MKVNDLSKQLDITNKELITFLKDKGYKISSHMQTLTDEMIDLAIEHFEVKEKSKDESKDESDTASDDVVISNSPTSKKEIKIETKTFKLDDVIPCRSVTPWKLNALGVDGRTTYHWEYFGDVDYLTYRDLQALRRTDYVTKPKFIIEDADLCYQWRRELGDTYKYFLGVEYPEEFFDLPDNEFEKILKKAPDTVKEVIKVTAMNMIKNENYPTIQKLSLIDNILGTCLKEFI